MKTALIIVDIQNDFLPGGALAVNKGDTVIPIVNALLDKPFTVKVASKDWHPFDHYSFAKTHLKNPGEQVLDQILWPVHCVQGTSGAEFGQGWNVEKLDKVFYKGTDKLVDSYSTFFDNKHLRSTGLHDYLKEKDIQEVYIAGLATDYCVKYTALDALHLDYKTFVVVDGCRAVNLNPLDEKQALEEIQKAGAHLILSKNI